MTSVLIFLLCKIVELDFPLRLKYAKQNFDRYEDPIWALNLNSDTFLRCQREVVTFISNQSLYCRNVFLPKLISVYLFLKLSRFDRMNRANKKNALKLKSLVLSLCNKKVNNYKIVDQKCNFFNQYDFLCVYEMDQSFTILNEPTQASATMDYIRSFTKLLSFLIFQNKKQTIFIFYKLKA